MRARLKWPIVLAALVIALPVLAQQLPPLRERMSAADFRAAGLDKLTPQQLQFLEQWLRAHRQVKVEHVTASGQPVFYPDNRPRGKVSTRLIGHFSGWQGHTEFTLDNGQIWKQAESGAYSCPGVDNPEVTIKPMLFGSWLMYVHGCNQGVRVERVK